MKSTQQFHCGPADWLLYGQLASHVDTFLHYLSERRYSPHTIDAYLSCIAHFARWMSQWPVVSNIVSPSLSGIVSGR
jgi:site-specific recombinase XerD